MHVNVRRRWSRSRYRDGDCQGAKQEKQTTNRCHDCTYLTTIALNATSAQRLAATGDEFYSKTISTSADKLGGARTVDFLGLDTRGQRWPNLATTASKPLPLAVGDTRTPPYNAVFL